MKNHCKFQSIIILLILVSSSFYAVAQKEPDSPLALSITTDAAYYPESSFKSGNDHFAPISGVFDSFKFCTTLNDKDSLTTLIDFSSRRSFEVDHDKTEEEPYLKCTGREWYFKRIAVSWTHIF
ncbi:MAG: hypothetical protein K6E51_00565 [Treponema sp.]|nr:hypothetical protein [Treponema sp.]